MSFFLIVHHCDFGVAFWCFLSFFLVWETLHLVRRRILDFDFFFALVGWMFIFGGMRCLVSSTILTASARQKYTLKHKSSQCGVVGVVLFASAGGTLSICCLCSLDSFS